MLRLPGVFSFLALLWAAGLAHADSIATFAFTGTLETPLANQTSVTGQFTVDLTTRAVNA
ncbi:MAG: hypothetical protein JO182_05820, partial [Acidobacteriaceae bacterium]|nr:hypothetical protein [Acidobacteriaceae bacterium]